MAIAFGTIQIASAQTATENYPVIALQPTPHPAGCADFQRLPNGMWQTLSPINIRNDVQMGQGNAFGEGAVFAGINIAQQLNQNCSMSGR